MTRRTSCGLTLVELLLALAITAIVGAAIAAMFHATALGAGDVNDQRRAVVQFKRLDVRFGAALRSARLVLEQKGNYIILWEKDTNRNATPNLAEIRLIELQADGDLVSLRSSVVSGAAGDAIYLTTQFGTNGRKTLMDTKTLVEERWETGVRSIAFVFDDSSPDVQSARLIGYRVGVGSGTAVTTVAGAAALRN